MSLSLFDSRYGMTGVRVLKLTRRGDRHELRDLTVDVAFEGDFPASHLRGDNAGILPADSMRNAVHALARDHAGGEIELFGLALTQHFLEDDDRLAAVRVIVAQRPWSRIEIGGRPQGTSFVRGGAERRLAVVRRQRGAGDPVVEAGIEGLHLLRTRGAGFAGFRKDRFTTLAESEDRLLAAELSARWRYGWSGLPYGVHFQQVRQGLLGAFVEHDSRSEQHTLYAVAQAVLEQCPPIAELRLRLARAQPQPVDLTPFGLEDTREVYVPAEEPEGVTEVTLRRDELG